MTIKTKSIKKHSSKKDVKTLISKNHPSKQEVRAASHKIMTQYKKAIKNLAKR